MNLNKIFTRDRRLILFPNPIHGVMGFLIFGTPEKIKLSDLAAFGSYDPNDHTAHSIDLDIFSSKERYEIYEGISEWARINIRASKFL